MHHIIVVCLCAFVCSIQATVAEGLRQIGRGFSDIGRGAVKVITSPFAARDEREERSHQMPNNQGPHADIAGQAHADMPQQK